MRPAELSGKRFGSLKVLERNGSDKRGQAKWKCQCDCGAITNVISHSLTSGKSISCGCVHGRFKKKDLTGAKFGKLTAISMESQDKSCKTKWNCICECGNSCIVRTDALSSGRQRSCGCLSRGENHYRWKEGLEEVRLSDRRYHAGVIAWRNLVYAKDGYSCQCCGDRSGGNLNAHHIESWDNNQDLRMSLDNGITLCDRCHKAFHVEFGFGNNTEKQLVEFLKKVNNE